MFCNIQQGIQTCGIRSIEDFSRPAQQVIYHTGAWKQQPSFRRRIRRVSEFWQQHIVFARYLSPTFYRIYAQRKPYSKLLSFKAIIGTIPKSPNITPVAPKKYYTHKNDQNNAMHAVRERKRWYQQTYHEE
jgi:hypothetical protein